MKPKQIIVLSIIFGVLALGILLKSWIRFASDNDRASTAPIAHGTPSLIDEIQISRPEIKTSPAPALLAGGDSQAGRGLQAPPVELVKEKDVWKVKSLWGANADLSKIQSFLDKLWKAMRTQEFRGKGKNLFSDFGIADPDAFSLKFSSAGKTLMDLRLGVKKAGESYFIRRAGDDSVYLVDEDMADLLGIYVALEEAVPSSSFWADLSLFDLDPERVTEIMIHHFKGDEETLALGLVREADPKDPAKSSWKFARKDLTVLPDPDKVLKFIAVLESVKAQKVVDPFGKGYGLEKPAWKLVVTEGSKKTVLDAGPKNAEEDLYYVKASSGPSIFSLNGSFFNDLNVDDTRLMKDEPVVPETKKSPLPSPDKEAV